MRGRRTSTRRIDEGRALRGSVPRSSHARFPARPQGHDPLEVLVEQDRTRIPELVALRWRRMAESPFAFLRGASAVMAVDLAGTARTGLVVQACGDAHLGNFGVFASPERRLLFDVNDFDETLVAPWEWDVKRLCTSLVVAARGMGIDRGSARATARRAVRRYREQMLAFAAMGVLDVWYSSVDAEQAAALLGPRVEAEVEAARRHSAASALPVLGALVPRGSRRIVDHPPLVTHDTGEEPRSSMAEILSAYRAGLDDARGALLERFTLLDAARKVVGVGSVGTRCFVALMASERGDALLLQVKEAGPSVLAAFGGLPGTGAGGGRRVVDGQRMMQAASDPFLGWASAGGVDYYVRQLRDTKASIDVSELRAPALAEYGGLCGWALARSHARSPAAAAVAGYLGTGTVFDEAVASFAVDYAEQTVRDHQALLEAQRRGAVPA